MNQPLPVSPDLARLGFSDDRLRSLEKRNRKKTAISVAKVVLGGLAAVGVLKVAVNVLENHDIAQAAETEELAINSMIKDGGKFYMGELELKQDAVLREHPAAVEVETPDGAFENIIENHPENLEFSDAIVVTNEEGTWFGVPRQSDKEDGLSTAYIWVNSDDVKTEIDPLHIVSFSAGENPESEALEEVAW